MERLAPFEILLGFLLLSALPASLEPVTAGQSALLQQLLEGREDSLHTYEEEAYETCRRYVALHDASRAVASQAFQAGSSREATSLMQADEEEPQQGPNLARDIRRPPSRARSVSFRGQGEEGDFGGSHDITRIVTSKKRSCIRRGGSCDARPSDCCYHSSCRCNLWGTNCRCMRMGLLQRWINGKR
ncbi:uncharacterized protein LOC100904252 [Galendromus occidentalis]|uniref:Uncharacterized protein LOC100904252 n=1 Tax=Galendromus occidentalis TaxID=34638 RepID=A0AAJ6VVL6_9ACAR|nr:uncharacterized protein LOC100904252 [Galendromus occidentalis]